jgi:hypothetical protein
MQGIWLEDQKLSFRNDIPEPKPQEGEAVIRTPEKHSPSHNQDEEEIR